MKCSPFGLIALSLATLLPGSRSVLPAEASASPSGSMMGGNRRIDTVPFVSGREGYACYRAPAVIVSRKGTILAFCEGRVNDHRDEGDIDIVLKRSSDGGMTWGSLLILADDGPNPCKCACPVVLPSGRILVVYSWNRSIPSEAERTTRDVHIIHSDDDGLTWSKRRDITRSVYRDDWRWSGTGPCHAIVKRTEPHKGRIIVPARHNTQRAHMVSHVIYSDDNGETWQIGGSVPRPQTTESTVVEVSNGDLMLNSRNQNDDENQRIVSISKDGGATFSEVWLETALIEPRGCQGSLLFHSLNARTGKGNILFSNPANGDFRSDGTLKLSEDDGRTWTKAFRYAPEPAPYFTGYSDIALLPGGDIAVVYERGDFHAGDSKKERYDEMGFTVVKFDQISEPLPATRPPASKP